MTIDLRLVLMLLCGGCWMLVSINAIRIGLKERTYAIPAFALALNVAWEFIYTYLGFARQNVSPAQQYFDAGWAVLDVVVVYTYFRYGRRYWPRALPPGAFVAWSVLLFAVALLLEWLFLHEFGMRNAGLYTSFLQNLLMSVLFIDMFVKRGGPEGQSLGIAGNKWIGTLAATIYYGWMKHNLFILVVGVLCSVFDLIYIGLLVRAREPGWTSRLRPEKPGAPWALTSAWPGQQTGTTRISDVPSAPGD